ncbi:unnamed protein product [Rhizophagus irregularis]|nr:unnamed protein product [Rhizophagus irregularis]
MFRNRYTPINHRQNYVRNRYNTFNVQSHHISNERVTKINEELYTHEDNIIIDMELDNERNENTENEEIINEVTSGKNSRKLSNKEKSGEEFTEESNEDPDEDPDEDSDEESNEDSDEDSDEESNEDSDEDSDEEESNGQYSSADEEFDEEFDEYFSEESNEESDEEPDRGEKVVDESLKNEHMPHISGEFAPYFSNITEALMFCWIQKHNICQKVERSRELWHGNIWKESPRFGSASIQINRVSYNCGDFVVYRESTNKIGRILAIVEVDGKLKVTIQRALTFIELPRNLQSNARKERRANEVWLFD